MGLGARHVSPSGRSATAGAGGTGKDSRRAQARSPTWHAAPHRPRAAPSRAVVSPPRTLRCRTVASGRFRLENHIRDLPPILLDESGGIPGPDPTPQPLDMVLAALGSCLASAIRTHAAAQGIVLSALALDIEADLAVAQAAHAHPPSLGFDEVRVAVHIESDASHAALASLVARATLRSQVASTLHDGTQLSVALAPPVGS